MALHVIKAAFIAFAVARGAHAQVWAQFCDDGACTVNCGESVDTDNPGCLNEVGRNSIYFHGEFNNRDSNSLVFSPTSDCPCQNECLDGIVTSTGYGGGYCYSLEGNVFAESFRFIEGGCGADNC